jgi:fatty-acyl-CoA synthase
MQGLVQDWPLTLDRIIEHAAKWHGDREVVSRRPDGSRDWTSYADVEETARRFSSALLSLGIGLGDRVATMAMNSGRHLECWYGIMGIGAVCHTLNPRLFKADLEYIVNRAADCVVIVDRALAGKLAEVLPACPSVRHVVVIDGAGSVTNDLREDIVRHDYDALIASHPPTERWGEFSENTAAGLCFTSGTTSRPKGVLYSHRSNFLHALMSLQADMQGLSARDVILPIVPMFHANAWGLAFSAPAVGAKLVMPGANLDPAVLAETIELEEVTFATGVPTVMQGLIDHYRATRTRPATLQRVITGGARCPERMIEEFEDVLGVEVVHGWGMTELSPIGTMNVPRRTPAWQTPQERNTLKVRQGRPPMGVDLRLVGDDGRPVPHDGETSGHLCVRGWATVARYYGEDDTALDADGYFDTGDIATIDPAGFMAITDRAKDLVKSGGEWISSQEIERHALSHPAVAMAAVIGVPHQKWGERPRLIIQRSAGTDVTADEIRAHLTGKIAAWWMPDEIAFRDAMPLNATGKIDKKALRAELSYISHCQPYEAADFKRGAQTRRDGQASPPTRKSRSVPEEASP